MKVIEVEGVQLHIPSRTIIQQVALLWEDLPPFKRVLILQGIFVFTGIFSTLCNQLVHYQGAAGNDTLLPAAATFLGMCLAFFVPKEDPKDELYGPIPWIKFFMMGCLEFLGCLFSLIGLNCAGSGIYQVVYASIVIWIALMSKWLLNKHLTRAQWIAVLITTSGVSLSAFGSIDMQAKSINGVQILGILITLLSTFAYGSNYILSEQVLSLPNHPSNNQIQTYTGLISFLMVLMYIFLYTIPNWETKVSNSIKKAEGSIIVIVVVYCGLVGSAFLHSWSYYKLVKQMGSVSTGILQSLRAVCVFFLSSVLYCDYHPEQCISQTKIVSAFIVIAGILYFTYLKKLEFANTVKWKREEAIIV